MPISPDNPYAQFAQPSGPQPVQIVPPGPAYPYIAPKAQSELTGSGLSNATAQAKLPYVAPLDAAALAKARGEVTQLPAQIRLTNAQANKAQTEAQGAPALLAATLADRAQKLADARAKDEATRQSRQSALAARQEQLGKTQNILKLIRESQGYIDNGWATGGLGNVMRHVPLISDEAKKLSTNVEAINQANAIYGLSQAKAGPDAVAPRITNRSEFNAYGNLALDPTTLDAPTMTNHLNLIRQVWQNRLNALTAGQRKPAPKPTPAAPKGALTKAADGTYDWHPQ